MTIRTRVWGQVGLAARRSAIESFKVLPPVKPPEPVGLVPSEKAWWGLRDAGLLIAHELPSSMLPLPQRLRASALDFLLTALPNTEKRNRWDAQTATDHLVDIFGGKVRPQLWPDWYTDDGWARAFVQGPCAGDLHREDDVWVVDASVLARGERHAGVAPLGVKVAFTIDDDGAHAAWVLMEDGTRVRPADGPRWGYARLVASAAMHNYVSTVRHVLYLHYVAAQAVALLVHNHLPWQHPIARVLYPHAAGTLAVNWSANRSFMGPNHVGEQTYAYTWKGIQELVPLAFGAFRWEDYVLPEVLSRRGTMELVGRGQYPYGEDALLIWNAVDAYVADYLSCYYDDDEDVQADTTLQDALTALDPGVPKPLRAKSLAELRLIIVRLINMVSVEHKLVSGIAYDFFTHPYFFPTLVREAPTLEEAAPYREEAENNLMFRCAISAKSWPMLAEWSHLALDPAGAAAMQRFRESLRRAGHEIDARNRRRKVAFPHLHPSELETSVAV